MVKKLQLGIKCAIAEQPDAEQPDPGLIWKLATKYFKNDCRRASKLGEVWHLYNSD